MKKIIFSILTIMPSAAFADNVTNGLKTAGNTIHNYLPVVTSLCYALAGIIAIIGAFTVYYAIQNDDPKTKKKIMMTCGSCFTFVAMATALPKMIGYEQQLVFDSNMGMGGITGGMAGGDKWGSLDPSIPDMNHPSWQPDPQYRPTIPSRPSGGGSVLPSRPGGLVTGPVTPSFSGGLNRG